MALDINKEQAQQKAMKKQIKTSSVNINKLHVPVVKVSNEKAKGYTITIKPSVREKMKKLATAAGYRRGSQVNISAFLTAVINEMWDNSQK